jgi:DNA-binding NarL/FixJ family response regulator
VLITNQNQHDVIQPIRVFLIEGQSILMWGLQQLIKNHEPTMQVVGTANKLTDAITALTAASPDVILLDLDLSGDQTCDIQRLMTISSAKVLVMTRNNDQSEQDAAILDGAHGVLGRDAMPEEFIEAISKVHEGQLWLDRIATGRIFVTLALSRQGAAEPIPAQRSKLATLTEREKKIVTCVFENSGDSAKAIASKLFISESTLRNHLTSIYGKLSVSNRFELIAYAIKNGFYLKPA